MPDEDKTFSGFLFIWRRHVHTLYNGPKIKNQQKP